ncbi:MAG: YtxH domain-containing protein [Bacteroidia bacterium]
MNKILISLMVGVVIGIMIAPDKGSVTIEKITGKKGDDLFDMLSKLVTGVGEKIKENANDLADKAKSTAAEVV